MSHPLTITYAAYRKGCEEARKPYGKEGNCPYGWTKMELQHWWLAGFHDCNNNTLDMDIIGEGKNDE